MKLSIATLLALSILSVAPANAQQWASYRGSPVPAVQEEPAPGSLKNGQKIIVLDTHGYCPPGYGLLITGARTLGSPRGRQCVQSR